MSRALAAQAQGQAAGIPPLPVFRFRYHLVPFGWGLLVTAVALGAHLAHSVAAGVIAALVLAALIVLLSRHLSKFAARASLWAACLTALWLPLIAVLGPKPSLPLFGGCWAVLTAMWARHYRVRPADAPPAVSRDEEIWVLLAEHRRWHGKLGDPERIPGGLRYPLLLDGIRTNIGDVLGQPLAIAAAWHKPITEAYAEGAPDGIASRGSLTLLKRGTLEAGREWDGLGVTADGFATIGRYADGADARIRLFAPMDGTRHGLISGTTGAGKTALLELMLHVMLSTGFTYPVVLDPQEGQSLPDWQGQVPYAAGADECMEMLTLLHQGMFARSRQLKDMTWDDDGHERHMSFFDHELTGWPVVAIIADEMHMLLTGQGRQEARRAEEAIAMVKDIGKLGRKTGTAMWLVTQVPSLEELGSQTLRSMLKGGNVICLRTADRVSAGMLGLPADPHDIPQYFPDGSFTYGLGYILGPDRRQAIARTDMPSREARRRRYDLPELEAGFASVLARFGTAVPAPEPAYAGLASVPADDSPAPGGQSAADAILAVLDREMERGEIIKAAQDKSLEWGRDKAFSLRAITGPLARLVEDGRVAKVRDGIYAPVRASLSLISTTPSQQVRNAGNEAAGA